VLFLFDPYVDSCGFLSRPVRLGSLSGARLIIPAKELIYSANLCAAGGVRRREARESRKSAVMLEAVYRESRECTRLTMPAIVAAHSCTNPTELPAEQ